MSSSDATEDEDRAASERHDDANRLGTEIANGHAVALFWAMAFKWITAAEAEAAADALLELGLKLAGTRYPAERYAVLRALRAWTLPVEPAPATPGQVERAVLNEVAKRAPAKPSRFAKGSTVFVLMTPKCVWAVGKISEIGDKKCIVDFGPDCDGCDRLVAPLSSLVPTYDPAHDGGLAYSDDAVKAGARVVQNGMTGVALGAGGEYGNTVRVLWSDGTKTDARRFDLGRPGLRTETPATTATPAATGDGFDLTSAPWAYRDGMRPLHGDRVFVYEDGAFYAATERDWLSLRGKTLIKAPEAGEGRLEKVAALQVGDVVPGGPGGMPGIVVHIGCRLDGAFAWLGVLWWGGNPRGERLETLDAVRLVPIGWKREVAS